MGVGETTLLLLAGLIPLGYAGFHLGRRKALATQADGTRLHSRPQQYGWYSVVSMAIPAIGVAGAASLLNLLGWLALPSELVLAMTLVTALAGFAFGLKAIRPSLRARNTLDRVVRWLLLGAALISIMTTIAIVLSVIFEAMRFFREVSFWEFITGTTWGSGRLFP